MREITELLEMTRTGRSDAAEELAEAVYPELRKIAAKHLRRERIGHTLQATALVHEAWVKLVSPAAAGWNDRVHFFAFAAAQMRHILVDHARRRRTQKRGGGAPLLELEDFGFPGDGNFEEILAVDTALQRLTEVDERQARIVEMRFFGGMTNDEIAASLDLSERTVKREWAMARAWLHRELGTPAAHEQRAAAES
jgi:RNA polymerase sigma factor (TIGR02999 family)